MNALTEVALIDDILQDECVELLFPLSLQPERVSVLDEALLHYFEGLFAGLELHFQVVNESLDLVIHDECHLLLRLHLAIFLDPEVPIDELPVKFALLSLLIEDLLQFS